MNEVEERFKQILPTEKEKYCKLICSICFFLIIVILVVIIGMEWCA